MPSNPKNLLELGEENQWETWTQPQKVKKMKVDHNHEVSKLLNPSIIYQCLEKKRSGEALDIISKLMVGWRDLLRNKKLTKWKETYKYLSIFLEFIQFVYAGCEYRINIKLRELLYLLFLKRRKIVEHDSRHTIPTKSFMNLKFWFIFTAYSYTRIYRSINYRLWEKSIGVLNWNNKYMYDNNELNNDIRIPCLI